MASKRLYQLLGEQIREQIIDGKYKVGHRLPPERLIGEEFNVSRTVVREAIIMLEVEGYVEVRKGSGIHVVSQRPTERQSSSNEYDQFIRHIVNELKSAGPFEMLQARQLIECTIASFAASQVTKSDIDDLNALHQMGVPDGNMRDSEWDKQFHYKLASITNNSVFSAIVELMWFNRDKNPLWLKLHEHIDESKLHSWQDDHKKITQAFLKKDPSEARQAMWNHIENTKKALYDASSVDDNPYDKYLFQDDPMKYI